MHVAPPEHPERGERLLAVRAGLERALSGLAPGHAYTPLSLGDASDEQLVRVHDPAYVERLGHLAGRSGYLDSDTYLSPESVAAARRAAGSTVALVDALHAGQARTGIAVPRPPGHHALADRAMGFCLLNNVAVGVAQAKARGYERVLVLDWDVHHGNGTEAIFYADPSVLFVSLHQYPNYPGTGAATDLGGGEGRGSTVNLPLPPGATDAVYAAAFERVVLPVIEQFAPDFALVSCGFDAHERDPLAQMLLSAQAYGDMTTSLLGVLPERCPLGVVLEGGYDLEALTDSSEAVGRALFGVPRSPAQRAAASISDDHDALLRRVAQVQGQFWRLP
ncbi:MAG TPA: histone deacetylase [Polyangiaceae bacterium]|nr:histone deacetylase [Polyangiaceae bacterium]